MRLRIFCVLVFFAALAAPVSADTFVLLSGGQWGNTAIWTQNGLPATRYPGSLAGTVDTVATPVGAYTVTVDVGLTEGVTLNSTCPVAPCSIDVTNGILKLTGSSSITSGVELKLSGGGSISNSGTLAFASASKFEWTNGTLTGGGAANVASGGTVNASGSSMILSGHALNLAGTLTYGSVASGLQVNNGASITVMSGGVVDLRNFAGIGSDSVGSPSITVQSGGTFKKTAGNFGTNIAPILNNHGLVQTDVNALVLTSGTHSGTFVMSAAGTAVAFGWPGVHQFTGTGVTISGAGEAFFGGAVTIGAGAAISVGNLQCDSFATFSGGGTMNLAGAFSWRGGTFSNVTLNVVSTGSVNVTGQGNATLTTNAHLDNQGAMTVNSGTGLLTLNNGGRVTNRGTITLAGDVTINSNNVSNTRIDNLTGGAITKSAGGGNANLAVLLNNAGSVTSSIGTIDLQKNGTHSGHFDPTSGFILFSGGIHTFGSGSSFASGTTIIDGATFRLGSGAVVTVPTLQFETGTIDGPGSLSISSQFRWMGGAISGTSTATDGAISTRSATTINDSMGAISISARVVNLSGSTSIDGANLTLSNGAQLNFLSGSVSIELGSNIRAGAGGGRVAGGGSLISFFDPGIASLRGARRPAAQAFGPETIIEVPFDNQSIVATGGTVYFRGGGNHTGAFDSTGGEIWFDGGTHDFSGSAALTGSGTYILAGTATLNVNTSSPLGVATAFEHRSGTLTGPQDFATNSSYVWSGGTMSGSGRTINAGGMNIDGANGAMSLSGRTLVNNQSLTYSAASPNFLSIDNGGKLQNSGQFYANGDQSINTNGVGTPLFANLAGGNLNKTNVGLLTIRTRFENSGLVYASGPPPTGASIAFANGGNSSSASFSAFSAADRILFTGGAFSWNSATNFSGTAVIDGAFVTATAPQSLSSLQLISGSLGGSATVTTASTDTFTWLGGTMNGGGVTHVMGTFVSSGAGLAARRLDNRTLQLSAAGDLNLTASAHLSLDNSSRLENSGTLSITGDAAVLTNGAGANSIINRGSMRKTGGTAGVGTRFDVPVVNESSGTIGNQVANTSFIFAAGGSSDGAIDTGASTASVDFFNGTFTVSATGSFTGSGITRVNGGTLVIMNNVTLPSFFLSSGSVGGSGTLLVQGGTWSGGNLAAGGNVTIAPAATFNVTTNAAKTLSRPLRNDGRLSLATSGGGFTLANGVTLTNSGTLELTGDASIGCSCTPSVSTIVNTATGTIVKNGGSANSQIAGVVDNSGSVSVTAAQLSLTRGGTHSGSFTAADATSIDFSGGTHTFTSTSSLTGAGSMLFGGSATLAGTYNLTGNAVTMLYGGSTAFNTSSTAVTPRLLLNGGTLGGSSAFTISGSAIMPSDWLSGTMSGSGVVTVSSAAQFRLQATAAPILLSGRTLRNEGMAVYSSATNELTLDNNGSLVNAGTFLYSGDAAIRVGTSGSINNQGLFRRTTSATAAAIQPAFTNSNRVELLTATTTFNSFTQIGGELALMGGNTGGTFAINGGIVSGAGTITGNLTNNGGVVAPGGAINTGTLTINGVYTQAAGGKIEISLGGTTAGTGYDVVALSAQPVLDGLLKGTLVNGFVPTAGQLFDVITWPTAPATNFATYDLPTFGSGGYFDKTITPTALRLTAMATVTTTDVTISQTASGAARSGDSVVFNVVVTNAGTINADNVSVSNVVSGPASSISVTSSLGSCSGTTCNLGTLAAGASATIQVTATASGPGTVTNSVSSTSTTADPNGANNSNVAAAVAVSARADVSLAITDNVDPVDAAANVTYSISVTNAGPDAASSAVVNFSATNGTIVSATGGAFTCGTSSCSAASLPAGTSTITVVVQSSANSSTMSLAATYVPTTYDSNSADNSASQSTSITSRADTGVTKSGPTAAQAGTQVVYTVTVTNNGPSDAASVVVNDPTPAAMTFVSNSGGCTSAYPCALGTLTTGSSVTITSTYNVATGASGNITNTATVTSGTADPNGSNNSAAITTAITPEQADLRVTKSGPAAAQAGTQVVYTVTVTNDGPSDAASVTVNDPTPAGLTFVSNSGGCTSAYPCALGTVMSGSSVTITSTYNVATGASGNINNTATVTSSTADPSSANNSAAVTTAITPLQADVRVTKSGPATVSPSGQAVYTITVKNLGPSAATAVTAADPTPAGLTFVSNSGACATAYPCALGTLAVNQIVTITSTYQVAATASGSITNTATVTSETADTDSSNNSSAVTTTITPLQADVRVTKSGPATVSPSSQAVYTITVKNLGPSAATAVTVADPTPAGLTFVSNSGACATAYPCALGTLAVNQIVTITSTYQVAATASGSITNTATVTSETADPVSGNNTAAATSSVTVTSADLSITKTAPAQSEPNASITYTITVTNNGPATASNVVVADPTPSRTEFAFNRGDCTTAFPCSLGNMAAGETRTITSIFRARSGGSPIVNTASVTSTSPDATATNNSATATTAIVCSTTAPADVAPANGTTAAVSGTLRWRHANASFYNVYLGRAGSGCNSSTPFATVTTPFVDYSGLQEGVEYEWRVEAVVTGCSTVTSACARFTVGRGCNTTAPSLTTPANGSTQQSSVRFAWTAANAAAGTRYQLFASVNGGPSSPVAAPTTALSLDATLPDGDITWYVVALADGCAPQQSQSGSFRICNPPAVVASVIGQAASGQPYTVYWTSHEGSTYELQEATNAAFTDAVTTTVSATSKTFQKTTTTGARAFFYRVRAQSACTQTFGPYSPTARVVVVPLESKAQRNIGFTVQAGSKEIVVQEVFVAGEGTGVVTYSATVDKPWLTVRPATGVLPRDGVTLQVLADPSTLPNGTFTGTVIVTLTTPSNSRGAVTNGTVVKSVPVSISLVTPVSPGSSSTPAPNSLVIPSVGHLDGLNSHWQSDIRVTNTSADPMQYRLTFMPAGGDANSVKQTTIDVEGGVTTALDDVVRNWYGVGSFGDSANGVLQITPATPNSNSTSENSRVTVASSRTYNVTANGTLGQYIPAVPFANFVGRANADGLQQVLSLQQIAQTSSFRTNVGLVEASGKPATVALTVFNSSGVKVDELMVNLAGGEQRQMNAFLAERGISNLADGRIEVKVTGGEGRVTAYASVVDGATNDPLLVSGVPLGSGGANRYVLPGVADLNVGIANWRTDMRVFNSSSVPQSATLSFFPQGGGAARTADLVLNPGEVRTLDNVLQSTFGVSNDGGAMHVTTPVTSNLVVTGRTYNMTSNGTYGQFVPAVTAAEAVGNGDRALQIQQVEDSVRFRTNIGLAEVTGNDVEVEISVILPDSRITPKTTLTLSANSFRQMPVIRDFGLGNVYNARVAVRVIGGQGRVAAYGSVIDMETQDPTYVPAQ